jgi:hypothetical protein
LQVIHSVHETETEKQDGKKLWATLGHHKKRQTQRLTNEENNEIRNSEEAEIGNEDNDRQQKIPGFIQNAAGSVYICPAEGCSGVFY